MGICFGNQGRIYCGPKGSGSRAPARVTWERKLGLRKSTGCKRQREEQSNGVVLMEKQDSPTSFTFPRPFLFSFSDSWATVLRTAHALSLSLTHHHLKESQFPVSRGLFSTPGIITHHISVFANQPDQPKWTPHLILLKHAYIE